MENQYTSPELILKKEQVGVIKSKMHLEQGTLFMTPKKIYLKALKGNAAGSGFFAALFNNKEENNFIFNIEYANINAITRGQFVVQSNVLEIKDRKNNIFRVIVSDYNEWERAIRQKIQLNCVA